MSDFDAVLERLLGDPAFAAALAADPDAALAGYRLGPGEAELLRSQVSADAGGGLAGVETRTNKSSTFGLFSAVADLGHTLSGSGAGGDAGIGQALSASGPGGGAGAAVQRAGEAIGAPGARAGFGDAPPGGGSGGADQQWHSGFGAAPAATSGFGPPPAPPRFWGAAPTTGLEQAGQSFGAAEHLLPPPGYHPHIDADGDGHWDQATFVGTRDHGVEIFVDADHDGHVDFVGHDTDRDGLVDYADYDKDDNGTFEKRMFDDNGDGWLDRTVRHRDD
jgi:hypothetical protein